MISDKVGCFLDLSVGVPSATGEIKIYPLCLSQFLDSDPQLTINPNDELEMRGYIRATMVDYYDNANEALKLHLRTALQWLLNGGYEQTYPESALTGFEVMTSSRCQPLPDDPKDFFICIWKEIYGENVQWEIEDFSAANYKHIDFERFLTDINNMNAE